MKYVLLNWSHFFLQMAIITFKEFSENFFKFKIYYFHVFLLFSDLVHLFLKLKLTFVKRSKSLIKNMHIDWRSIWVHRRLHGMSGHRVHRFILRHPPPRLRAFCHMLDWGPIWVLVVAANSRVLLLHFYLKFLFLRLLSWNKLEHDLILSIALSLDLFATLLQFLIELEIWPIGLLGNASAWYDGDLGLLSVLEHRCAILLGG